MLTPSFTRAVSELPLPQRLLRVFYDPRASYEAVRDEPGWQDWLVPVALMCLVWAAANWLTLPLTDPALPAMQERFRDLTAPQQDQAVEQLRLWRAHGWYTMPVVNGFSTAAAVALVLLALARWVFRGEVALRQALVVKAYGSVIGALAWVVRTPLMLLKGTLLVHVGPGALVSESMSLTFAGRVLVGIDLFDLWQVWVLGVGLAVMAEVPVRRAVVAVGLLWGLWILFASATAALPVAPA
ncbi:MAG: hypothetical protein ABIL09_14565 [Gemmatimonadota bacterium]